MSPSPLLAIPLPPFLDKNLSQPGIVPPFVLQVHFPISYQLSAISYRLSTISHLPAASNPFVPGSFFFE
jgi:hypothetical protein